VDNSVNSFADAARFRRLERAIGRIAAVLQRKLLIENQILATVACGFAGEGCLRGARTSHL
jgi:hypothetical protein